jgi:hypothetical protein
VTGKSRALNSPSTSVGRHDIDPKMSAFYWLKGRDVQISADVENLSGRNPPPAFLSDN